MKCFYIQFDQFHTKIWNFCPKKPQFNISGVRKQHDTAKYKRLLGAELSVTGQTTNTILTKNAFTPILTDRTSKQTFPTFCNKLWNRLHFHQEIILEADISYDGEEIDDDDRQHGRQDDGATVLGDRLDHVPQCLLSVDHIQELQHSPKYNTVPNTMICSKQTKCLSSRQTNVQVLLNRPNFQQTKCLNRPHQISKQTKYLSSTNH